MTLKEFIKVNKQDIDLAIRKVVDNDEFKIDNEERELWILNDMGLFHWAKDCGVKL